MFLNLNWSIIGGTVVLGINENKPASIGILWAIGSVKCLNWSA